MEVSRAIIEFIFSAALFINAVLFIPQVIKIYKEKAAKDVSMPTFLGFLLIQFAIVLHGLITKDYLLVIGYLLSMVTCGSVVVLIFFYRKPKGFLEEAGITHEELLQQLPGHVYWKNVDGKMMGCNINNWKDFGLTSFAEYEGKVDHAVINKKDADLLRKVDLEVMKTEQLVIAEEFYKPDPATEERVYLSHKVPLKNKKGKVIGILGTSLDITSNVKNNISEPRP